MRTAFCAACLVLSTIATAQEAPPVRRQPERLTPLDPYPESLSAKYFTALNRLLRVDETESSGLGGWRKAVTMIERPPFDPEWAVTLRERRGDGPELVLVSASCNFWYSMPENRDGGERGRKREKVHAEIQEKAIDRARADRMYALWERMLRGVCYPDVDQGGIEDATSYEFRWRQKRLYGEASSPEGGPAEALIEVGKAMASVCRSAGDADALASLDKACDELEKRLAAVEKR